MMKSAQLCCMRLQWQQTVKNPNFVRMQQIAVGTNRASGAHPDAWYHRRWLLVSRFPGNTTILPEVGHQCWDPLEYTIKGFWISGLQRSNRQCACQNSARRSSPGFLDRQYTLFVCESCGYKTSKRRANSISSAIAHARLLSCAITGQGLRWKQRVCYNQTDSMNILQVTDRQYTDAENNGCTSQQL